MSTNLFPNKGIVKRQASPVIWLTGLSGSGKSTIANELELALENMGIKSYVLDGDNIRAGLNKDLGFSDDDRKENMRRIAETAKLFADSGTVTIAAFISPFRAERAECRDIIGADNFVECHVDTSLEICESRDVKGLYAKARAGIIPNFTGIDSPYEEPTKPDMVLEAGLFTISDCVDKILTQLNFKSKEWSKKNHGGSPTSNKDKKRAIFVGRFQPYHQGHLSLVQQKLNEGKPALIMVRDIEPDAKNPFTTEQTVSMIEKYHASKGDDVEVMVIPDIESVNYGRGVGYEINEFTPPENLGWISATKVRQSIIDGNDDWKKLVDESIQEDVANYLINNG